MTIEPCPSCEQPPVIVEDTGTLKLSIGCRQVFLRRPPGTDECEGKYAMMDFSSSREHLIDIWNAYVEGK